MESKSVIENRSLFEKLKDFEARSIAHDVSSTSQRDGEGNWDGVVFRLGEHRLTIGITEVEEILTLPASTPVPGAHDWLIGMANVRGNLVTIVDLGWFLFGSRTPITTRTRLILTRLQGRYAGLIVDEVFGQRHFNRADLSPLDDQPDALEGLVQDEFPQGEDHWGRFQLRQLMTEPRFLDGSA